MTEPARKPKGSLTTLSRVVSRLAERVAALESGKQGASVPEEFKALQTDMVDLHKRYELQVHKVTVATEVSFYVRYKAPARLAALHAAVVWAFDQPDEWWKERENLTIAGWVNCLEAEHRAHLQAAKANSIRVQAL